MTFADDVALVRAWLGGDRAAGDELGRRLQCIGRILQARSRSLCGGLQDQELLDIGQDVLAKVLVKLPDYAGRAAIESWVFAFCEGELRNALRRRRRAAVPASSLGARDLPEPEVEPAPETHEDLFACLDKLAAADEQLVRWKHYDGLKLEEIAARSGQNLNTVKSRYYRALLQLRACLERREGRNG